MLLLPDGSAPTSEDALAAAQQLDFEQTYDGGAGSWTLRIAGAPAAGRLDAWCSACRSAAAPEQQEGSFAGLLSSQPLPGGPGNAALVLHLRGVELPAAAGAGTDASTSGLSASRRRLAQAGGAKPQPKCDPVTVGGKEYTFASCTQPEGYDNLQVGSMGAAERGACARGLLAVACRMPAPLAGDRGQPLWVFQPVGAAHPRAAPGRGSFT